MAKERGAQSDESTRSASLRKGAVGGTRSIWKGKFRSIDCLGPASLSSTGISRSISLIAVPVQPAWIDSCTATWACSQAGAESVVISLAHELGLSIDNPDCAFDTGVGALSAAVTLSFIDIHN